MSEEGRPANWATLRQLKRHRAELSRGFSAATACLRPELISSIMYGTLSQIISIFLVIATSREGTIVREIWAITLFLAPAVISTLVPSWSCQTVLDVVEETRGALLTLEARDVVADRQVAALLAAVQRDLETFGDLSFFRLQLSTTLSTTSTVITYIIIMVQFQMSENGNDKEGRQQWNDTNTAVTG